MTPEQVSLATRATEAIYWKWMPGMLIRGLYQQYSRRIQDYDEMPVHIDDLLRSNSDDCSWTEITDTQHGTYPGPWLPDFEDPATLGCLLYLVRKAYLADWIDVVCEEAHDPDYVWRVNLPENCITSSSESESLILALEAAEQYRKDNDKYIVKES